MGQLVPLYSKEARRRQEEKAQTQTKAKEKKEKAAAETAAAEAAEERKLKEAAAAVATAAAAGVAGLGVGTSRLCRAGTYPKSHAPMLAKVPKNTSKVPTIACSDAVESTQITAKVPKMTFSMGIIRVALRGGRRRRRGSAE